MSENLKPQFQYGDLVKLRCRSYIGYPGPGGPSSGLFGPYSEGTHAIFVESSDIRALSAIFATIIIDGKMGISYLNDLELVQSGKSKEGID
jgi:hypothetical protein